MKKLAIVGVHLCGALVAREIFFGAGTDHHGAELITRATSHTVDLNFSLASINLESNKDGFSNVDANGLVPLSSIGDPAALVTGRLVAVPDGANLEVTVGAEEETELTNVVLAPTQRKMRCESKDSFQFHSSLYKSNEVFPSTAFTTETVGRVQGIRLVRLGFNPLRMDFSKHALKVTTRLTLKLRIGDAPFKAELSRPTFDWLKSVSANGEFLGNFATNGAPETMLIVVADSLQNTLQPFVQWKREKGIRVDAVTVTAAGGDKDAIKTYVQKYYDSSTVKPTYLLFVGGSDLMPPFLEDVSSDDSPAASDFSFTLLNHANTPAVFYGRFVADSAEDLQAEIDRSIAYEKATNGDWLPNGTTIASDQGSNPSDKDYAQGIIDILKSHNYQKVDGFFQGDGEATASNVSNALQSGRSWLSYIGHGSGTSWASMNDHFSVSTIDSLDNDKLPIIFDVACDNGRYHRIDRCFGKAWVTHTSKGMPSGALAYYGATVSISWDPPAIMSTGIAKYHFEKQIHSLGGTILAGQTYLIEQQGTGSSVMDNLKWYTLFGDPSLEMRTNAAKSYSVNATRSGANVQVKATGSDGKGVADLLVSVLTSGSPSPSVARTDANGSAAVSLPAPATWDPNTKLTVSGYNAVTYQSPLP